MSTQYLTACGQLINVNNWSEKEIHIEDIAHHLSKIQRFGGALPLGVSYSVAEHSLNLANYIFSLSNCYKLELYALLHDASEAYLSDLVSPVKKLLKDYQDLEEKVDNMIYNKFMKHLYCSKDRKVARKQISYYDKRILLDEVKTIIPERLEIYKEELGMVELDTRIMYNDREEYIYDEFMSLYNYLINKISVNV